MCSVIPALSTKLLKLESIRRLLLVFRRYVVPVLTLGALKRNIISCHNFLNPMSIKTKFWNRLLKTAPLWPQTQAGHSYSITSETVPAPTVLPPSLIANLNPFSIAIGAINSIVSCELSPGITISTPSFSVATPVTSVVRK